MSVIWFPSHDHKASGRVKIPANQVSDPLVAEAFHAMVSQGQPGPGINHITLISNKTPEHLVFYMGNHFINFPEMRGHILSTGRFTKLSMTEIGQLVNSDEDLITAISQSLATLSTRTRIVQENQATPASGTAQSTTGPEIAFETSSLVTRAPVRACGMDGTCQREYMDGTEVTIRLTDEENVGNWNAEWSSSLRRRALSTEAGASPADLYVDLALEYERIGQSKTNLVLPPPRS